MSNIECLWKPDKLGCEGEIKMRDLNTSALIPFPLTLPICERHYEIHNKLLQELEPIANSKCCPDIKDDFVVKILKNFKG